MFEVKGDRAQWRVVYDRLASMTIGQTITHDELARLLPNAPAGSIVGAFHRAVRECEAEVHRTFANVRGVGYRMVDAAEHERLARDHHRRAKRQLKRSKRRITSADRSRLTVEERQRFDALELNLARQMEMTNRLNARVAKVESDLQTARRQQKSESAQLADRVDKLADLLVKHGITGEQKAAA